ncbi:MAG: hypothetical protein HY901_02630 [Deltaproteobacteria bacterium]|nr:hypothetical protein [Deltaproteobacteria bacterium]
MTLDSSFLAVHLNTRVRVRLRVARGHLDEPCAELIERMLDKSLPRGLSGFVFRLAQALGASQEDALGAGTVAEFAYAAVDLADDIEDGDASRWLSDVPEPLRVNLVTQAVALALAEAAEAERTWGASLAAEAGAELVRAASGQRAELLRETWSVEAYVRSADATAGPFRLFLRAAAAAARRDPGPLLRVAAPLALLCLIRSDEAQHDLRWLGLDVEQMEEARARAIAGTESALAEAPPEARPLLEELAAAARSSLGR